MKKIIKWILKIFKVDCKTVHNIIYDSEDNIVNFDNQGYITSWDYDTDSPANDVIGVTYVWLSNDIIIVTDNSFNSAYVNGREVDITSIGDNKYKLEYIDLSEYINNMSSVIYIQLIKNN